jgi:hypothetical protein
MSNADYPAVNLADRDELEAHSSFVARYDFRNHSRWNGDGEHYRRLLDDLASATECVRWYTNPGNNAERETLAYYADRVHPHLYRFELEHPYLYMYELDPFGNTPVVVVYSVDAAYTRAVVTRHAPRHLADYMLE